MLSKSPIRSKLGSEVHVSPRTRTKAIQLHKYVRLRAARIWAKDEMLLRTNLLLVPTSVNYLVLNALGRNR